MHGDSHLDLAGAIPLSAACGTGAVKLSQDAASAVCQRGLPKPVPKHFVYHKLAEQPGVAVNHLGPL